MARLREQQNIKNDIVHRRKRAEEFLELLVSRDKTIDEFDEDLFNTMVQKIKVFEGKMVFEFKDGSERCYIIE